MTVLGEVKKEDYKLCIQYDSSYADKFSYVVVIFGSTGSIEMEEHT